MYKTVKFDFSKLHQSDNGIFMYELSPIMEHAHGDSNGAYRGMMQILYKRTCTG
ncbi:MAG: hypothetical protein ACUVRK_12470 [Spirochaetota bacterium]